MKQFILSVYDKSAQVFGRPVFCRSQVEGLRSFEAQVLETSRVDYANPLNTHAGDFALMHLGWFDDETGKIENLDVPVRLVEGAAIQAKHLTAATNAAQAALFGGQHVSTETQGR